MSHINAEKDTGQTETKSAENNWKCTTYDNCVPFESNALFKCQGRSMWVADSIFICLRPECQIQCTPIRSGRRTLKKLAGCHPPDGDTGDDDVDYNDGPQPCNSGGKSVGCGSIASICRCCASGQMKRAANYLLIVVCLVRLFKIRLRRSSGSVFADDAILESTQGPLSFDMDAIYQGQLEGE